VIERVIELAIKNRFAVFAAYVLVVAWGLRSVAETPVDAIPDLSENQVIVFTDWMGRSPREIEDQVTYPLSLNLQGLAGVKAVRSSSEFNFSMVDIIFDEDTDFYFARERVLERLALASTFLPPGVVPYLAPDATALGQIFWYTVEGPLDPGRLRAVQDWYVRYQLNSVPGVAQVATVGGSPIEYQVDVDPNKLRAYGLTLGDVWGAIARANGATGGRVLHMGNAEYLVRGIGWIQEKRDLERIVLRASGRGTPVLVSNVATVALGPQFRRSTLEKDGGEVTGGVVLMRFGENPLEVTKRVKDKIVALQPGLPEGVRIVPFYDRTRLIEGAIHTLTEVLTHEVVIASLAILLILGHLRSAFVICLTLPLSALVSFILMRRFGIASNIMSLSGIAISIGILVDQAIVMVENATHHLTAHFGDAPVTGDTREIVTPACRAVGRPIFFSVLIILLSFIPVFALRGMEGKTFHPLAFTKSFAMVGTALISITLVPALIPTFVRGRLRKEESSWLVRSLAGIYRPILDWALDYPWATLWFFVLLLALGWQLAKHMGREYMPPLDEGSILDMPITVPRASVTETADDLQVRDELLRRFPEVEQVVGKGGRADTPTDPAPLDMIETVVNLHPREIWPRRKLRRADALAQAKVVFAALGERAAEVDVEAATDRALERFDAAERELAVARLAEAQDTLADELPRRLARALAAGWVRSRNLRADPGEAAIASFVRGARALGERLARGPAQEDVNRLAAKLVDELAPAPGPSLLELERGPLEEVVARTGELLGRERATLLGSLRERLQLERERFLGERVRELDGELLDRGAGVFDWALIEEMARPRASGLPALRASLDGPFARRLLLWRKDKEDLVQEMDQVVKIPGWGNIWTQPIINRIDMLATGVRTMIGIKVFGKDQDEIQRASDEIASVVRAVPGAVDVFPDQSTGKGYVEVRVDRDKAARYGISVGAIEETIEVALGGRAITTTVEGRERYPVRVRYGRDWRGDERDVANVLVAAPDAASVAMAPAGSHGHGESPAVPGRHEGSGPLQIPLGEVADVKVVEGPSMIKSENGLLRSYVQLNVRDRDVVGFVEEARAAVERGVKLPAGTYVEWSGQFEHQVRARRTLQVVFPAVILLIFVILYLTYGDLADALLMMMAVPEALVGGIFFLWLTGTNFSVAVWVGFIACFGMATETGIIMLVYLREAIERRGGLEGIRSLEELRQAVVEGAVHRLRPKLLTEGVAIISLAPMLWASGVGHEVLSAMAAPVLGGLLVSDEVVDLFIPVRFYWIRRARWLALHGGES